MGSLRVKSTPNPLIRTATKSPNELPPTNLAHDAWAYWIDACQRAALFLNVLQERSDRYEEHNSKVAPHVLKFGCELVMDGRKLQRPVNYALVRVLPPDGTEVDQGSDPSSLSIRVPATSRASAASRRRAKSASPSKRGIPATSSDPCRAGTGPND